MRFGSNYDFVQAASHLATEAQVIWRRYWLLRWTSANMLGWSLAMLAAMLLLEWFGLFGAMIGGGAAGLIVGGIQSAFLPAPKNPILDQRQWMMMSALGGLAATIPVYLLAFVALLHFQIGLFFMGACAGGMIGALQSRLLMAEFDDALLWWVGANILAGGLCAPLTLTPTILPLFGTVGPVVFGVVTGSVFLRMQRSRAADE